MDGFEGDFLFSTGPQDMDLAVHTLEGMIKGIAIDSEINEKELETLNKWISAHVLLKNRHPFNELIPRLKEVINDQVIDPNEKSDIIWLCQKLSTDNVYYNKITSDLQRLKGVITGIVADGEISKKELKNLNQWLDDHLLLKNCWPYDEIVTVVAEVLKDEKIDIKEHRMLLTFFEEFTSHHDHGIASNESKRDFYHITGVCASNPDISFKGKTFSFAGKLSKKKKSEITDIIIKLGGEYLDEVIETTNYLIIGTKNNPTWVYACYGRKVEAAVELRKKQQKIISKNEKTTINIQLIHEVDFWKASKINE